MITFAIKKNSVLFIKTNLPSPWAGLYMPIGGHIDPGETFVQASEREFFEETGLVAYKTKLKGVLHQIGFYGKDVIMFVTTSTAEEGDLINSEEGEPIWLPIAGLVQEKLVGSTLKMFEACIKLKSNEIFIATSEFDGKDKELKFDLQIHQIG